MLKKTNIYKKYNLFLGLILLLTPLAYYPEIGRSSEYAKYIIFYFLVINMVIFNLIIKIKNNKLIEITSINSKFILFYFLILIFFFIWNLICMLFSINVTISLGRNLELLAKILITIFIFLTAKNYSILKSFYYGMVGIVVISVIGIFQKYDINYIFEQIAPPAATFINKNQASHYLSLVFFIPFIIYNFCSSKKLLYFSIVSIILLMVYSVSVSSKGLWVSLFFTTIYLFIALYFYKKNKKNLNQISKKNKIVLIFSLVAIFFSYFSDKIIPGKYSDTPVFTKIKSTTVESSSVLNRIAVWRNSLEIIKDYPVFGVGPDGFQIIYPKYNSAVMRTPNFSRKFIYNRAHNDFIQYFVETGILGGLLFYLLVICVPILSIIAIDNAKIKQYRKKKLLILLSAGLVNVFVYANFEFTITLSSASGTLVWIMLGIWLYYLNDLLPKFNKDENKKYKKYCNIFSSVKNYNYLSITAVLFCLIMILITGFNIAAARTYRYANLFYAHNKSKNPQFCAIYTNDFLKAAKMAPFNYAYQRYSFINYRRCQPVTEKNLKILESFLDTLPYNYFLWHNIIEYQIELKKYSEALILLDKYIKYLPYDNQVLIQKGNVLEIMGEKEKAIKWYKGLLENKDLSKEFHGFVINRIKMNEDK
ncbi:MAG: O-antigen ligase family protein [Spirochaetia bacterium]|nr:O-antigen ligase family protein [Spirochaetia bacterium]